MKKPILFFCVLFLSFISYSQTKWEYPVKMGTPEWKSLKSIKEVYAVQQIPKDILSKMTTKEVFLAYLELPGRLEVLAYNTMQKGFDITANRFNVIPELLNRPHASISGYSANATNASLYSEEALRIFQPPAAAFSNYPQPQS
jgi:hypothetical protein